MQRTSRGEVERRGLWWMIFVGISLLKLFEVKISPPVCSGQLVTEIYESKKPTRWCALCVACYKLHFRPQRVTQVSGRRRRHVVFLNNTKEGGNKLFKINLACTAIEGEIARCGPGANCFIIDGVPTCHCIVDVATGLPLAGNPYKACTWDISGTWQLYMHVWDKKDEKDKKKPRPEFLKPVLNPLSNEPFMIRLDRTDALLRTRYLLGAIFVVTPTTSAAAGIGGRVFLDARDNITVIIELAEGFADHFGRSLFLRTRYKDTALTKLERKLLDKRDFRGNWEKNDGTLVEIYAAMPPQNWPTFINNFSRQNAAFWYNDPSFGDPLLRLSTALFLDDTLPEERAAFQTNAQFVQLGWYGALRFGSNRIDIFSPATGQPIYSFIRVDTLPPLTGPPLLQEIFKPTVKELVMMPTSTKFQIAVEPPKMPVQSAIPVIPLTTGVAQEELVAERLFREEAQEEILSQDVLAAASNLFAGLSAIAS